MCIEGLLLYKDISLKISKINVQSERQLGSSKCFQKRTPRTEMNWNFDESTPPHKKKITFTHCINSQIDRKGKNKPSEQITPLLPIVGHVNYSMQRIVYVIIDNSINVNCHMVLCQNLTKRSKEKKRKNINIASSNTEWFLHISRYIHRFYESTQFEKENVVNWQHDEGRSRPSSPRRSIR